jgi:hypothetical protein
MSLLVLFDRGGIPATEWPLPARLEYEIKATDTDETRTIPDAASRIILFSGDADWKFAVDLETDSGASGDGRKLRQDEEVWLILSPGVNRILHMQTSTSNAKIEIEFF